MADSRGSSPVAHIDSLPLGPAQQKVTEAVVLPMRSRAEKQALGILIAGVNPTRKLDEEYRTFYNLVADNIATAITNARTYEEERKRAQALAELDRAKTIFFSNVSHEFRTPLTLMLGPIEAALARPHNSEEERRDFELLHRNAIRLLKLVNALLDFSRIEAGRVQAEFEPVDLAQFTSELASVFRSAAEKAGLQLRVECDALPQPVYVDREMWEKIVLNLLSNAFKSTFAGEISVGLRECDGLRRTHRSRYRYRHPDSKKSRTCSSAFGGLKARVAGPTKAVASGWRWSTNLWRCTEARSQWKAFWAPVRPSGLRFRLARDHLSANQVDKPSAGARHCAQQCSRLCSGGAELAARCRCRLRASTRSTRAPTLRWRLKPDSGRQGTVLLVDDNHDMRDYVRRLLSRQFPREDCR